MKWSFLLELLSKLGFPPLFVSWIRECITTPKFSLNINGELAGFFGGTRGLRHGDPLSPYLFAIIMDALSMLIQKNIGNSQREGIPFDYHWRCKKRGITHLCFADDLMLCGGVIHSVQILCQSLQGYYSLLGLMPNKKKSIVFIAGRNQ